VPALVAAGGVLVLLVLAGVAARSGGYASSRAQGTVDLSFLPDVVREPARSTTLGSSSAAPTTDPGAAGGSVAGFFLGLFGFVVLLLIVLVLLRWRPGWRRRAAAPVAVRVPDGPPPPSMAEAVQQALDLVEQPGAREAVVRAWLLLGRAAAEAGSPPRPADTAAEYAARVADEQGLDPTALGRLAALYREARFSTHPVGEDQRAEARAVLEQLRARLGALR
jgi:hypothetical protein